MLRMNNDIFVIYHAGCWDGFCSAWVAGRTLGRGRCKFLPAQYGDAPPNVSGQVVYILDFSYPRDTMQWIASEAEELHCYDHHKTAAESLVGLPGDIVFNDGKSGARITWEQLGWSSPSPWLVDYTEDRDLWRHKLQSSREVNAALRSYPLDHDEWDALDALPWSHFVSQGRAILREQRNVIDAHVRHAVDVVVSGHTVKGVNATMYQSEIAGELAKGRPFGVVWFDTPKGIVVSLRSTDSGVDVSDIARAKGGGGHARAAGFTSQERLLRA